jgi:CRISPR-associated protein Cas1
MYKERIPDTIFPTGDLTLSQLRGIEGAHVRSTYGELSKQYGVTSFRRQARNANDPVNKGLTACNAMLYGLATAVCSTLSLNPALGVIHEGNSRSFLFDLADIYKMETSFAVSFEFGRNGGLPVIKKEMRQLVHNRKILERMLSFTQTLLTPYLPSNSGEYLFDSSGFIASQTNWGLA